MKIWLPYLRAGSGTDVYTEALAEALTGAGHEAVRSPFLKIWQFFPWRLRFVGAPADTNIILANTVNGFVFRRRGCRLVVVEHHCVFDDAYAPYRGRLQALYHEYLLRPFEGASLRAADALVAVSGYTARSLRAALGGPSAKVILNAVDTEFFCPAAAPAPPPPPEPGPRPLRLLFVGNLIRRKGADLLPRIMGELGAGFELHFTVGLRGRNPYAGVANMKPLGRLSRAGLREAYRAADLLLLPSRLEGFGYAAAEAMACATPVVASATSSLPEIVEDRVTGRLCPVDDVDAFVAAVRELAADRAALEEMGRRARQTAVARFGVGRWVDEYVDLFGTLMAGA